MNNTTNNDNNDDTTKRNSHQESPPSRVISAYAIDKLGKAIIFMIAAYMNDNYVSRTEVVNMLEDIIQKLESRMVPAKD